MMTKRYNGWTIVLNAFCVFTSDEEEQKHWELLPIMTSFKNKKYWCICLNRINVLFLDKSLISPSKKHAILIWNNLECISYTL